MSKFIAWLGSIWSALLAFVLGCLLVAGVWEGWVMPIWHNPRGFFQGVYILSLLVYALVSLFRIDESLSRKWPDRIGFFKRALHFAAAVGAAGAILTIGLFLFRGIWPEGVAFSWPVGNSCSAPC